MKNSIQPLCFCLTLLFSVLAHAVSQGEAKVENVVQESTIEKNTAEETAKVLDQSLHQKKLLTAPIALVEGPVVNLQHYKGVKPVYLKFWASWCQPCLKEMPHFQKAYQQYGKSVEFISINLGLNDTYADVQAVIKQHGLTMPLAIDEKGDLAEVFNFVGTPYHLLFDANMNLVYRGHEANESLDNKLALLASNKSIEPISSRVFIKNAAPLDLKALRDGKTAVLFTSTWCHWYLKETRPNAAKACDQAQKSFNKLARENPKINWLLVVSNLWTGEKDLAEYKKQYSIAEPVAIDQSNSTFLHFGVKNFPEWVFLDQGNVIYQSKAQLSKQHLNKFGDL